MVAAGRPATAADPVKQPVELNTSDLGVLGLPLAEAATPVRRVVLTARLDASGAGSGTLVLGATGDVPRPQQAAGGRRPPVTPSEASGRCEPAGYFLRQRGGFTAVDVRRPRCGWR